LHCKSLLDLPLRLPCRIPSSPSRTRRLLPPHLRLLARVTSRILPPRLCPPCRRAPAPWTLPPDLPGEAAVRGGGRTGKRLQGRRWPCGRIRTCICRRKGRGCTSIWPGRAVETRSFVGGKGIRRRGGKEERKTNQHHGILSIM
jgi:hypothetical protein